MIRMFRRWLNRKKPLRCLNSGWSVPIVGTREDQAVLAWDHWVAEHEHREVEKP